MTELRIPARWLLPLPTALATAVLGVVFAATRQDLPDPVATHFAFNGTPDDSTARDVFFWVLLNLGVLATIVASLAAWRGRGRAVVSSWAGGAAFVAGLSATLGVWTAGSQRGLSSWQAAQGPGGLVLVAVVCLPILVALAVFWLGRTLPLASSKRDLSPTPSLGLSPDENAVFHGRESAPAVLVISIGTAIALAIPALIGLGWAWLLLSLLMLAMGLTLSGYAVTAGAQGLVLRWGLLGWPRQRIALERIASAHPVDIRPLQWGGWGYRGSLRFFGKAAVVLRGGPGLRLDLRDDTQFALTLHHPETVAGLLNDLIARGAPDRSGVEG